MSDVFISYGSADSTRAAAFGRVFAAQGWSVWWDRNIPPGKDYDDVIQEALRAAKCVVVLWSRHSVASRWVLAEAQEGADREILVPVAIEDATIPLGFRRLQIVRLIDWDGEATVPEVTQLISRVAEILHRPAAGPVADVPAVGSARRGSRMSPLVSMAAPTILALLSVGALTLWRTSSRVDVEITASRARFRIGAAASNVVSVFGPGDVTSLSVEKFQTITFEPSSVERAEDDPHGSDGALSEAAWRSVPITNARVVLAAGEHRLDPAVTFESAADPTTPVGRLDAVRVAPASVITLESLARPRRLVFRLDGPRPSAVLAVRGVAQIFADHARIDADTRSSPSGGSVVYRTRLRSDSPLVEVTGAPESLMLSFGFPSSGAAPLSGDNITLSTVEFTALNDVGARVSAVTADGQIAYPDYPDIAPVPIHPRDFIGLEPQEVFTLREITAIPTGGGIRFHFEGRARRVTTSSGDRPQDHRLTALDVLWHNPRVALLCTIVVWVLPTTIAVLRLQNDLKRQ